MVGGGEVPLVSTIREQCRMCYTCLRECPAKAIRIVGGQAEVIAERCIGCGNCVRVCGRGAKQVRSSLAAVARLLAGAGPVAAMLAPSFPAEFDEVEPRRLAGMILSLGFASVHEVAFGADLVAAAYRRLLQERPEERFIATSCPALVKYVEKYHPGLVRHLAPIVSPMVAMARALRAAGAPGLKLVFIGPCLAKKDEARDPGVAGEVDEVLTFAELRRLFADRGATPEGAAPADFDPPRPELGMLYPVSRGSLQAAHLNQDLVDGEVIAADGRSAFVEAIKEIRFLDARLLEVLCCNGCVMGAGMTSGAPLFRRVAQIRRYVKRRLDEGEWGGGGAAGAALDLSRTFRTDDRRLGAAPEEEVRKVLLRLGKADEADELDCGACGYESCREHAEAILHGMAESEMCLPYTIEKLRESVRDLADSHQQLSTTQEALMQSERLASMGQLAAGIAHEVNNPLGAVLLYAHLLMEECPDGSAMREDLQTIVREADRCKTIVSGLLNFARRNRVAYRRVALAGLLDQCLRVMPRPEAVALRVVHHDPGLEVDLDSDQMTQVLANLVTNALAAMPAGGTLAVESGGGEAEAWFKVADTGVGIPREHWKKIYTPFFTTKGIGRGTGLGLAVTYGIIKMHRGRIDFESNAEPELGPTGTTFTVRLPREHKVEDPAQRGG